MQKETERLLPQYSANVGEYNTLPREGPPQTSSVCSYSDMLAEIQQEIDDLINLSSLVKSELQFLTPEQLNLLRKLEYQFNYIPGINQTVELSIVVIYQRICSLQEQKRTLQGQFAACTAKGELRLKYIKAFSDNYRLIVPIIGMIYFVFLIGHSQ
ncbi:hypothetical protein K7432_013556 [Basidiobolus ranarum]|uniref:Uncharacterized protein n=1 Tax=Basidiobolus ranarum TaxID=34480 RepID=A0ABR2VQN2_9FUNG